MHLFYVPILLLFLCLIGAQVVLTPPSPVPAQSAPVAVPVATRPVPGVMKPASERLSPQAMDDMALAIAKQEVTRILNTSTAGQFPADDTVYFTCLGCGESQSSWVMHSYVGTRNAAGKLVRVPWSATMFFECDSPTPLAATTRSCWYALVRVGKISDNGKLITR